MGAGGGLTTTRRKGKAEEAFRALLRVYGLIGRIMQPYFGRMGISGSQWGLLRTLYRAEQEKSPGLRILELGSRLLIRPPSVSGLVNRLCRLGYVQLIFPETDHRCKEVHLTDAGRALVENILKTHGTQIELLMQALHEDELPGLTSMVTRLGDHLDHILSQTPSPMVSSEFFEPGTEPARDGR